MGKKFHDELSPMFIKQKGASVRIGLSGSGIGSGLSLAFYDEYENDIDSVFVKYKSTALSMRSEIDKVIDSGELIDDTKGSILSPNSTESILEILAEMKEEKDKAFEAYDFPVSNTLNYFIEKLEKVIK